MNVNDIARIILVSSFALVFVILAVICFVYGFKVSYKYDSLKIRKIELEIKNLEFKNLFLESQSKLMMSKVKHIDKEI